MLPGIYVCPVGNVWRSCLRGPGGFCECAPGAVRLFGFRVRFQWKSW